VHAARREPRGAVAGGASERGRGHRVRGHPLRIVPDLLPLGRWLGGLDGEPLPDREHVVATQRLCASTVVRADDPSALVVSAEVEGVTIGFLHVDLAVRRVVAQDLHIRRVHVFSLEGERVASLDALGATYPDPFHFGQAARWLWILERDGRLRRFDLEALA